jgi:flagellar biosynthesis protein FlhA
MTFLKTFFGRNHDLALVIGVISILLILFAPIPPMLLDLLIITNFAFGLTILLLTFYVERPVSFSTFPSLLLIATLFRLSLNVAATRLILTDADAGQVIGAIGSFAVQGNFVIGLVVFFILVVVQYVVVTSGAQRVSEVAARFVLDAIPGQQMSIDADLNMGLIDQTEAKDRRKSLEKEAAFYGAMDGASKFVKGDAIAGIIILLINIIAGLIVGVSQMGMELGEAMETFTLLTIGDGIVTQVPALIISVATGIIVTRSSADTMLSREVFKQLSSVPRIQLIVLIALFVLLMLPGMPKWPILLLMLIFGGAWFAMRGRRAQFILDGEGVAANDAVNASTAVHASPAAIEIAFGSKLGSAWQPMHAMLSQRIAALRSQYLKDSGFNIPQVTLSESKLLGQFDYEILFLGNRHAMATLHANQTLAIRTTSSNEVMPGPPVRDPAFGLPAVWIDPDQSDRARGLGYTLVDPLTVLVTHLTELIKGQAAQLLSRADVVQMLEGVRSRQSGLIEELIPTIMSISDVQRVLQNLLTEDVPIKNIDQIVEALVDVGRQSKDPLLLTEMVRQRLRYTICQTLRGSKEDLAVLTLDPTVESAIIRDIKRSDGSGMFVLDPRLAEQLMMKLIGHVETMMKQGLAPVLLCGPDIRRHLKTYTQRALPRLSVLSVSEVPHTIDLRSFAVVSAEAAMSSTVGS